MADSEESKFRYFLPAPYLVTTDPKLAYKEANAIADEHKGNPLFDGVYIFALEEDRPYPEIIKTGSDVPKGKKTGMPENMVYSIFRADRASNTSGWLRWFEEKEFKNLIRGSA